MTLSSTGSGSPPNPRWMQRRQALHAAFEHFCNPPDASWLAHLGYPDNDLSPARVRDLWAKAPVRPGSFEAINHVYVHVPFCKSICSFCNYERLRPSRPELLHRWRDRLLDALETLAPGLAPHRFHSLYVGGGTPSVLPAPILRQVVEALDRHLDFHPHATRYFEMDPAVASDKRLKAWGELGFRHVSFGVQTLEPDINADHNRGRQDRALVQRRFEELRAAGVADISCDFLLGLAGTTPQQIFAEIEEVLQEHQPKWVDIYHLTPTNDYVDSHFDGDWDRFWAHLHRFQERTIPALQGIAERTGYEYMPGDGHHHSLQWSGPRKQGQGRAPRRWSEVPSVRAFSYSQLVAEQDRPLSLLGLGTSARSRIFGTGWVEYRDPEDDVGARGEAVFQGHEVDMADEARAYLVYLLRDGHIVDRQLFRDIFGHDVIQLFPAAVSAWQALGSLEVHPDRLIFQEEGRRERLRSLLWLVQGERLEWEIAKHRGLELDAHRLTARLGQLRPGAGLGQGWSLSAVDHARLTVDGPAGATRLRVAPSLDQSARDGVPRLVVEEGLPAQGPHREGLRKAVLRLRVALAAGAPAR